MEIDGSHTGWFLGGARQGRRRTEQENERTGSTVMGLALAVFAAPEGAPVAPALRIVLGSAVGGERRGA